MIVCVIVIYVRFKGEEPMPPIWVLALLLLVGTLLPYCQIKHGCYGDIQCIDCAETD